MVRIEGGKFLMGRNGGPDEEASPAHEVAIAAFYLDEKPVTIGEYRKFLQSSGRPDPAPQGRDDAAVTNITWDEASSFCLRQGKRLPSEDEWEFAARGPDGRLYPWGETRDADTLNDRASNVGRIEPVGARPKNRSPFGVLDMVGNVWQWCSNDYSHYPGRNSSLTVPHGAKAIRGGSFESEPWQATAVSRNLELPSKRSPVIGFRCAKSASEPDAR
jgi:formylglycine-generating enzyme required for sulfatase activity